MFKLRVPITCALPHVWKRLSNGVTVIVVEDKTNTKPAAAMTFRVGKNNDPADFPGLAHFCEHMLFMGTAKYPSEDAYHTAVKQNGGSCNASTSNDQTCYYFTSSLSAFKNIVDMFLEFFVDPSFNASAVERELNAVNSEDERNHTADGRRVEEMMKTFVVPEHPRSRYGSGNMITLKEEPEAKGLNIHTALRDFFDKNYVADKSCVVLYSPYSAEEMFSLVEPSLLRIKSSSAETAKPNVCNEKTAATTITEAALIASSAPPPMLAPSQVFVRRGETLLPHASALWCNVLNVSKQRSITLKWHLPFGKSDIMRDPSAYLSHIIGHEVEGSILAALRSKGLATALSAGGGAFDDENEEFNVKIVLTDKGTADVASVLDLVFSFIELLRRVAAARRISTSDAGSFLSSSDDGRQRILDSYEEMRFERRIRFEYQEVSGASSHASRLSRNAVTFGAELAFCANSLSMENGLEEALQAIQAVNVKEIEGESAEVATSPRMTDESVTPQRHDLFAIERCIIVFSVGNEEDLVKAATDNDPLFFGSDVSLSKTTRFHKMRYSYSPFSSEMIARWSTMEMAKRKSLDPALHIPSPNPFLAEVDPSTDFLVYGPPSPTGSPPERFETRFGYALVKQCEDHLQQPKLYTMLNIFLTNNEGVSSKYYREVMVNCVNEALIDLRYFADLAGLHLYVISNSSGLVVRAEGPSAFVGPTLVKLVDKVLSADFLTQNEDMFARHHKKKQLALLTAFESQPSDLASAELQRYYSADTYYAWQDALEFSHRATYNEYRKFTSNLLRECRTELVVVGNIKSVDSVRTDLVEKIDTIIASCGLKAAPSTSFPPYNDFYVPKRFTGHDKDAKYTDSSALHLINLPSFSKTNVNAAVTLRLSMGDASPERFPLIKVLGNIIAPSFFNTLRSTETLGYAVGAGVGTNAHREAHMRFAVQSPVADPLYLFSRIYAFIDAFGPQVLDTITEEAVQNAVTGLIQTLEQKTVSVSADGLRVTSDRNCIYGFDWREKEVLRLKAGVTRDDLVDLYQTFIANTATSNSDNTVKSLRTGTVVFLHSDKLPMTDPSRLHQDLANVVLPPMRKQDLSSSSEASSKGESFVTSGVADSRLVMKSFSMATDGLGTAVSFIPIHSKEEAHLHSIRVEVPHA